MIDITELYIFILVYVTLTLIQGHGMQESKNFCANYLLKLSMDLDEIWRAVETCWFGKCVTFFISGNRYSRERIQLWWFCEKKFNFGLLTDIYRWISFKLGAMIDTTKVYSFIPVWIALTFIQGFSWIRKQKLLLSFSCKFLNPFTFRQYLVCCHDCCWILFAWLIFKEENSTSMILKSICLRLAGDWMLMNWSLSNFVWWL